MNDLIKALHIFMSHMDDPTREIIHCEHDEMFVCIKASLFSEQEIMQLDEYGFLSMIAGIFLLLDMGHANMEIRSKIFYRQIMQAANFWR